MLKTMGVIDCKEVHRIIPFIVIYNNLQSTIIFDRYVAGFTQEMPHLSGHL